MPVHSTQSEYRHKYHTAVLLSDWTNAKPALPRVAKDTTERREATPFDQAPGVDSPPKSPCDPRSPPPQEAEAMAPKKKKPLTLAQIRAESATFRASAMPVSRGSAFDKLTQKNAAFENGVTRKGEFNQGNKKENIDAPTTFGATKTPTAPNRVVKPKRKSKQKKPIARSTQPQPSTPKPPVVECWRTSAGALLCGDGPAVPTPFLGIARVPTWKEEEFKDALRHLLEPLGGAEEFATDVHDEGGEFYSEISARFEDEIVAATVLNAINGALCHGRKLQVSFAPEFL